MTIPHPSLSRPGRFTQPIRAKCSKCNTEHDARDLICASGFQCRDCYEKREKKNVN
jgi:hypothetical protein